VDNNVVTISAEVKREKEEKKGEEVIHSERYYGKPGAQLHGSAGHRFDQGGLPGTRTACWSSHAPEEDDEPGQGGWRFSSAIKPR
jgi:hypothetical protein